MDHGSSQSTGLVSTHRWTCRLVIAALAASTGPQVIAGVTADGSSVADPLNVPSGQSFNNVNLDQASVLNVTGGDAFFVDAFDTAEVNLTDGRIFELNLNAESSVDMSGGEIATLNAANQATADISGGQLSSLELTDSSAVHINTTGAVGHVATSGTSRLNILGTGNILSGITAMGDSSLQVSGGQLFEVFLFDNATFEMSGGSFFTGDPDPRLDAGSTNRVIITGGTDVPVRISGGFAQISGGERVSVNVSDGGIANISGGMIVDISLESAAVVNVFGEDDLAVTGNPFDGLALTGTLADGTAINARVFGELSHLRINPPVIPEPATGLALGLGSLAWAGRRRQAGYA